MKTEKQYSVFAGFTRVEHGSVSDAARAAKVAFDRDAGVSVLVFDDATGRLVDFDLSGTEKDVVDRAVASLERRGRGRPKLGVDCGEVCLLPRHWEWLAAQPRSASATIRRLIDSARKSETPHDRLRERVDAAASFMWGLAGDLPDFEEASRALYNEDWEGLRDRMIEWPADVREHVFRLLGEAEPAE